jgi:short subunit dehydrogenase-like uncharacterized protein
MTGRIVVFGAAGYTGRLVTRALVDAGVRPILAGRRAEAVEALADRHGGLPWAVADAVEPETIRDLVDTGDVLVSTAGPFSRIGIPAVAAAVGAGAHYVDSTGEIAFIRQVWEQWGPKASAAGVALLPAFGYDFVPGNLAGALAVRASEGRATGVDVGYFFTGRARPSSGTLASLVAAAADPALAWRRGRLVEEPALCAVRSFDCDGRRLLAGSIGGSEHLALPRSCPELRDVGVYLGWLGPAVHVAKWTSAVLPRILPSSVVDGALRRVMKRTGAGPSAEERAGTGSRVLAVARDSRGRTVGTARVEGIDAYTLTGRLMAWAAQRLAAGPAPEPGALGPVDAWGLDELASGARACGLTRVQSATG